MKFKKIFRDKLEHCYAVLHLQNKERDFLLVASEEDGACYAYDLDQGFKRIEVWPDVGGTMTMVQIPGTLDFLATQRFYPGFQAQQCRLICERFNGTGWDQSVVAEVPYLHRFDLIRTADSDTYWYIGCTVAGSKKYVDDWSDPGGIFVGKYHHTTAELESVQDMGIRLTKNHGYCRVGGEGCSFITAKEGIYKLYVPQSGRGWRLEQVNSRETSDIVPADINMDGCREYMAIEGFHGDRLRFYDESFHVMPCRWMESTPFGHALFGGTIYETPCFIFGYRAGKQDLIQITWQADEFHFDVIDRKTGTSNVLVFQKEDQFFLLAANREISEAAVYVIQE